MAPKQQTRPSRKRAAAEFEENAEILTSHSDASAQKKVRWEGKEDHEEGSEFEEENESRDLGVICLATTCLRGRVACAYYDPVKCLIYVLEDAQETQHFDLIQMILEQVEPNVVLSNSKADDNFLDFLRERVDASGGVFQIRPQKDFVPTRGRDRLLSLQLLSELPTDDLECYGSSDIETPSKPQNAYDFARMRRDISGDPSIKKWNATVRLSNFVSLESSPLCLSSIGALLDYIARQRAVSELEDEGVGGLDVRNIEGLILDTVMRINADALSSLQIFGTEDHASVHSGETKEGLSLYGILNNTKTTLGRSLLRTWLLRPTLSIPIITARHDAVDCFLNPENLITASAMHSHLAGIKNIPRILSFMRTGKAKISDWQGLVKFAMHAVMLKDSIADLNHASHVDVVQKLDQALDVASFRAIGNVVHETIDWEESINACRVCVKPHVDEELDKRKHVYHGIDTVLAKVAEQISLTIPADYASSLNVVYFPQLGFLICLPMLEEWKSGQEIRAIDGWSFQFFSETHVYFKSQEMRDMDTHIGDLHPAIVDREIEIVKALEDKILVYDEAIVHVCNICAEIDCLLSFAEASRAHDYCRPNMVEENIIDIRQGRHPLQEQVVDTFVPNDSQLIGGMGNGCVPVAHGNSDSTSDDEVDEWRSVVICTGANACGKSVYLKQIALIQYMAQIGCFVPAASATLGITDKIFTRIQTKESVSKVQSAFMIDLNQVSFALRNATSRSLILLDEFGKGTVTSDGAGLFAGVLVHLLARGAECPKVLAATHFRDVFVPTLLDPGSMPVTFLQMQVMFTAPDGSIIAASELADETPARTLEGGEDEDDAGGDPHVRPGEKITYLYRVAKGLARNSHAAKCAELFSVPRRVVQRARYVTHLLETNELGLLLDEEMTDSERADLADAEEVCRRFLAWDLNDTTDGGDVRMRLANVLGRAAPL